MPNIKISELSAPIAVTDSDLIPGVQSGVTRRLTWGGLKSTLAGALGRSYLGLGTAATANVTTSAFDTTAGRVMKTGDAGILGPTPGYSDGNALPNGQGFYCWYMESSIGVNFPLGSTQNWQGFESGGANANRGYTMAAALGVDRLAFRTRSAGVNGPWCENWHSRGTNTLTVDTASFGYGTGSGGTVTQATSKSTAVTLNKPSGTITMAATALAAGTAAGFVLNSSTIGGGDGLIVTMKNGGASIGTSYNLWVGAIGAGQAVIVLKNVSGASLSEAITLNFQVIKGATA